MKNRIALLVFCAMFLPMSASADYLDPNKDSDNDGLTDAQEAKYGTHALNADSDHDGFYDGNEVYNGFDPLAGDNARLPKRIDVDLSEQRLRYYYGEFGEQGSFLISSGLKRTPTPVGDFKVQKKKPTVNYRGVGYNYPNTKWNLQFIPRYYIHGAYWHNNFGKPMSHGCVNVSYENMEKLYAFADEGIDINIHR